jgi:hypothetical protein
MSDEELRTVEDDAIRDVVAMQRDVGLQSATDGEFRRASWHMDFIYRLGGVSQAPEYLKVQFRNPTGTGAPKTRASRRTVGLPPHRRATARCRRGAGRTPGNAGPTGRLRVHRSKGRAAAVDRLSGSHLAASDQDGRAGGPAHP